MDPWRQQILADIGLATWIPRDQLLSIEVAAGAEPLSGSVSRASSAGNTLSALSASLDGGPATRVAKVEPDQGQDVATPRLQPVNQKPIQPVRFPEVACLWCADAVLFCPPAGLHGQVRLAKDILAGAASNWTQPTEQVVFRWAELQASGFEASEADRALLAFAEKRIEVCSARWVLCTSTLHPLLAELVLPAGSRLLGLAELADLARKATLKQALWEALEAVDSDPAADE